jgi:hypothetical protein
VTRRAPWTLEELLARADQSGGPDACWPWLGARFSYGYGKVRDRGLFKYVHRLVFMLVTGCRPDAVMHRCDNPPCINPAHLDGGSLADNARDMWAKGRAHYQRQAKAA